MSRPEDSATRFGSSDGDGATLPPERPRSATASDFDDGGFTPGAVLLGRYRIVGLIGRGGMGEVYRAQDLKLGQVVALKFLPQAMRDPARLERFLNEVKIARQISHPNVCRVYDVSDIDGRHFLSMEFVDGEDLASLLTRIGRLPPDKGVEVARQICAGLAAAHDRGVLHRDLKPANIMIDGRGHARLADFGLAAVAQDLRGGAEFAGTPAYMAPEQFEGREISTRTDLYALGLVLHELFTGKRLFTGGSVAELREQHRQRSSTGSSTASSLTDSSVDLDPAIDRIIQRCLDPDPQRRPASALAVSAALPGGDPLAAALAAGETPSPELVAGSGEVGVLAPPAAWALLAAFTVGLLVLAWSAQYVRFYRLAPGMRSPDVLASRAGDFLESVGYGSPRPEMSYGWQLDRDLSIYVRDRESTPDRWERLSAVDAPAVIFWYRHSPRPLVPYNDAGEVAPFDPPLTDGMANLTLTPRGRLVSFRGIPADADPGGGTADWTPFFAAAGLDRSALTSAEPGVAPHTFADARAAWQGTYPGRPDWTVRVEAAARGARVVQFDVNGPWDVQDRPSVTTSDDAFAMVRRAFQVGVQVIALVAGAWLARRNLRAGRADLRGARLVGLWTGVSFLLGVFLSTHHSRDLIAEWGQFQYLVAAAGYWGGVLALVYLALEPFVRRRWPEALVSWTRLVTGRVHDPLVGRDVLIGSAIGIGLVVLGNVVDLIPEWTGQPPISPASGSNSLNALGPLGAFLGALAIRAMRLLGESLIILLLLLLSHALLRNRWLGNGAFIALLMVFFINRDSLLLSSIGAFIFAATLVVLITRFGVIAYMAAMFAVYAINDLPLSLDTGAWYAGRSAIAAAMMLAVAGWGFWAAQGRRVSMGGAFD